MDIIVKNKAKYSENKSKTIKRMILSKLLVQLLCECDRNHGQSI